MNVVLLERFKEESTPVIMKNALGKYDGDISKIPPEVMAQIRDFDSLRGSRFEPNHMRLYNVVLGFDRWNQAVEHEWTLWHTLMMSRTYCEITYYIRTYFHWLDARLASVKEIIDSGSASVYKLTCDPEWKSFPVETKTIEWVWRVMQSHTKRFCKSSMLGVAALLNAVAADAYRNGATLDLDARNSQETIDAFLRYLKRLHVKVEIRGQAGQHLDTVPVIGGDIIPRFVVTEIEVRDPLLGGIERIRLI